LKENYVAQQKHKNWQLCQTNENEKRKMTIDKFCLSQTLYDMKKGSNEWIEINFLDFSRQEAAKKGKIMKVHKSLFIFQVISGTLFRQLMQKTTKI
jgi:hypothetical protein